MSGEEHQVVGEDAELTFPLAGLVRLGPEGAPEPPLVPAEGGFGLPALAVHPTVATTPGLLTEPLDHLPAVSGLRPLAAPAAAVQWDDGGPHPKVLPAVSVVLLRVERGVGQHPVPGDGQGRRGHDPREL